MYVRVSQLPTVLALCASPSTTNSSKLYGLQNELGSASRMRLRGTALAQCALPGEPRTHVHSSPGRSQQFHHRHTSVSRVAGRMPARARRAKYFGRSGIGQRMLLVRRVCASPSFKITSKLQRAHACPCRLRDSFKAAKRSQTAGSAAWSKGTTRNTHRRCALF